MKDKRRVYETIKQFVKFGMVGVLNTAISLIVYYVCVFLGLHYGIANVCGFVIGTLNAFFWNSRFVFVRQNGEQRDEKKTLVKTFVSYGVTLGVSTALLAFWIDVYRISEIVAPILNLLITIPANFLMNKYWTFKQKGQK